MNITEIIKPIQLLSGTHAETAKTGQGCFMNVIAYLNGEPQITDKSPCVCEVVRQLAIWLNDYMNEDERQQLIPFIHRAMGSKTEDKEELVRRAWLAVDFANEMKEISTSAAWAARAASAANAANAAWAARAASAAASAADSAAWAARAASAAAHQKIVAAGLRLLDAALPQASEEMQCVIDRAHSLVSRFKEMQTA